MSPSSGHKFLRRMFAVILTAALVFAGGFFALRAALPDTFSVAPGEELTIESIPFLTVRSPQFSRTAPAGSTRDQSSSSHVLTVLGIPVKTVRTVIEERKVITACGMPFGIKMFSDGALVVAFSDLDTASGTRNPAKEAGLRLGDVIISVNGVQTRTNEELTQAIASAGGNTLQIVYRRENVTHSCALTPVKERDGENWRAGIWVRDSSAGIGTLTFVDPQSGVFGGLGHAISDSDTGTDLPLLSGEIVPVTITGCVKGSAGSPGELKGEFTSGAAVGTVYSNDLTGVYGKLADGVSISGTELPVANMQEIALGEAEILTTTLGTTPHRYKVRIERVNMTAGDPNRNLMLRVTDPALLSATGGIVQGMSGSPILQDGKIVGAVTHVLVNDPTMGYGIFIENMLDAAS